MQGTEFPLCAHREITEEDLENHGMIEVGKDLQKSPSPVPAQAGTPSADLPGPCSSIFQVAPSLENPTPLWTTSASTQAPSQ